MWRVDLNPTLTSSTGGVLARLGDYTGDDENGNPLMAGAPADERRMYNAPEVTPIYDQEGISKISEYDVITITSGFRAHPLDKVIQDRIYAIRDYKTGGAITVNSSTKKATNYPLCGGGDSLTTCSGPITETNLFNTTNNIIQDGTDAQKNAARAALKAQEGWYIVLENPAVGEDPKLLGEKGLSKTTVIDGKVVVTTYIPPQTCSAWTEQGASRLYVLALLTGEAIFADFDGDSNTLSKADRYFNVGKGLPSQAVPVFQDGGVTLIVSTGGGSATDDPGVAIPVATTFWFDR